MFEEQDKFVDDLGRILTITSLSNGVIANLEGEIKNFISEDAFNNYLSNNKFDKINLTPEDHIEEFEQEVQHLINVEDNTMKTESLIKKLDRILESDTTFRQFKKNLSVREESEVITSSMQFFYYGLLPGSVKGFLKSPGVKSLGKIVRFLPDRLYMFSFVDKVRNLVRFFVMADGTEPVLQILPLSLSKALKKKLSPLLVFNLIEDNLRKIKPDFIGGSTFFVKLDSETEELLVKFKTEEFSVSGIDLETLLMKFKTKGERDTTDVYESRMREEDEDNDEEDDYEEPVSTEDDESDPDEEDDYEITDDDIDTDDDFNDDEETGDETEIHADDIEEGDFDDEDEEDELEPVKTESSLRRSLVRYCKSNESTIRTQVKRKKVSTLIEKVVKAHPKFRKNEVIREFKNLISTLRESMSLTFDKPIKSMNTSMEDGKTILTVEFEDSFPAPEATPPEVTTDEVPPAEDVPPAEEVPGTEEETTEETPKTEESFTRRTNRFLNRKF